MMTAAGPQPEVGLPRPKADGEKRDSPVGQSLDQILSTWLICLTKTGRHKSRVRAKADFASAINPIWAVQMSA
jgi:hypothetical protein